MFRKSLFSAVALIGMTFAFYGANSVENVQLDDDLACDIAMIIEKGCNESIKQGKF